jgi:hypothetical protein
LLVAGDFIVLWLADFSLLMDLVVRFGHLLARVVRFDWFHALFWPLPCGRGLIFFVPAGCQPLGATGQLVWVL